MPIYIDNIHTRCIDLAPAWWASPPWASPPGRWWCLRHRGSSSGWAPRRYSAPGSSPSTQRPKSGGPKIEHRIEREREREIHTHIYIYIHLHTYAHIHVRILMPRYMYIYVYTYIHTYICTHTYIYIRGFWGGWAPRRYSAPGSSPSTQRPRTGGPKIEHNIGRISFLLRASAPGSRTGGPKIEHNIGRLCFVLF